MSCASIVPVSRARLTPWSEANRSKDPPPAIRRETNPAPTRRSVSRPMTHCESVRFLFCWRISSWTTVMTFRAMAKPPSAMEEPSGMERTTSATDLTLSVMSAIGSPREHATVGYQMGRQHFKSELTAPERGQAEQGTEGGRGRPGQEDGRVTRRAQEKAEDDGADRDPQLEGHGERAHRLAPLVRRDPIHR